MYSKEAPTAGKEELDIIRAASSIWRLKQIVGI
jgi:hypothetical protein